MSAAEAGEKSMTTKMWWGESCTSAHVDLPAAAVTIMETLITTANQSRAHGKKVAGFSHIHFGNVIIHKWHGTMTCCLKYILDANVNRGTRQKKQSCVYIFQKSKVCLCRLGSSHPGHWKQQCLIQKKHHGWEVNAFKKPRQFLSSLAASELTYEYMQYVPALCAVIHFCT